MLASENAQVHTKKFDFVPEGLEHTFEVTQEYVVETDKESGKNTGKLAVMLKIIGPDGQIEKVRLTGLNISA
ncbi:MAG: hypothetical protein GF329_15070 [Candidatus Lokiarchaeota archaeon]|nr:hypothetical protein [Candidatus Lokiarchaeota archaeon]